MAVTNTVRAVLNTTTGRWFLWDRDGDRFEALPANGVALTATGAGTNAIHVYRIIDDRGQFQPMVATVANPATLKVYVKDAASGNLVLKEEVSCTSFADNHCEFVLAGDYAAETTKYVRLDFADGTAGSITASFSAVTLYEQREGLATPRVGTFRILSAAVSGIDDKRVKFESSNPAVCRIERGTLSSLYVKVADSPQQTDEYCVLVGVASGTAIVTCTALGDGSTTTVSVIVEKHPDDDPLPGSTGLAAELEAKLDNIRCPISLLAPYDSTTTGGGRYEVPVDETKTFFMRAIEVPGDPGDLFTVSLKFTGTETPRQCGRGTSDASAAHIITGLCIGLVGNYALGRPMGTTWEPDGTKHVIEFAAILTAMGCESARLINSSTHGPKKEVTETLNRDIVFQVMGGDTIVLAWLMAAVGTAGGVPSYYSLEENYTDLPVGHHVVLCTVNSITFKGKNEAP